MKQAEEENAADASSKVGKLKLDSTERNLIRELVQGMLSLNIPDYMMARAISDRVKKDVSVKFVRKIVDGVLGTQQALSESSAELRRRQLVMVMDRNLNNLLRIIQAGEPRKDAAGRMVIDAEGPSRGDVIRASEAARRQIMDIARMTGSDPHLGRPTASNADPFEAVRVLANSLPDDMVESMIALLKDQAARSDGFNSGQAPRRVDVLTLRPFAHVADPTATGSDTSPADADIIDPSITNADGIPDGYNHTAHEDADD